MTTVYTVEQVAAHNKATDAWIIISGKVYDVTGFLAEHPGGKNVVLKLAGKDATKQFEMFHNVRSVLQKYGKRLCIGVIGSKPSAGPSTVGSKGATFGELTPYGDPNWYQGWNSTYYNDSHRQMRAAMRKFVDEEIIPYTHEWDEAKTLPEGLHAKCGSWLPGVCGGKWATEYAGREILGGVKPEDFDYFHELIIVDELARTGSCGVLWGIIAGIQIGLPPVLHFGPPEMRKRVAPAVLRGQKVICLAITEPWAGSDVRNLKTTAKKTPCGKYYIVNGVKKWITNGVFADYFTTAVRTGGAGNKGISMLLIEKTMPGVTCKQMNCMGVWASGTTYITFEDVRVPVSNLIGKENEGFKSIMTNFNHERWGTVVQANRFARVCIEDSINYAHKRKTFGKRLIDHPVIRNKLAHMIRKVEATHAWLEQVTYQLTVLPYEEASRLLGGPIALLKAQATQTMEFCAREAAQIFGGLAYTRGGQGEKIERLYREVRALAIPAGSEEIMLDLGVRQAMKKFAQL